MILITDSGSTKAHWCLVNDGNDIYVNTQGISPYFQTSFDICEILKLELLVKLPEQARITRIYYYGTGCNSKANIEVVDIALKAIFPEAVISITHDLMAASRALCGNDKGIVSIMGTGSNSCFYDGKDITWNKPGLGYVLGDEGSGAYLGKILLQHYLYNEFPEELKNSFEQDNDNNYARILEGVYKSSLPNRYLASFSYFLAKNRGHEFIEKILKNGLNDFFVRHILDCVRQCEAPLYFTGGIAWNYRDIVAGLCEEHDLTFGRITRYPMVDLVKFHRT
ncbi:N-acetylglucosamine kinase [Flavitalea sp.]|nr:hypothetical protein [Flavitalea sp.]